MAAELVIATVPGGLPLNTVARLARALDGAFTGLHMRNSATGAFELVIVGAEHVDAAHLHPDDD